MPRSTQAEKPAMEQPYTGEDRRESRKGFKFDPSVNLGHLLTFVGFLITIMVTWSTLDKRVVVLEESRKAQELRDTSQDLRNTDQMTAIKETLVEIKTNVIGLREKLDRK